MIKPPNNKQLFGGFIIYTIDLNDIENSFLQLFEKKWANLLKHLPFPYAESPQLLEGSRLRPILALWGFCSNIKLDNEKKVYITEELLDLCVSIELLHKSSIIIDDLIDKDEKRKGNLTFHKQYGENNSILFVLVLVGKAVKIVNSLRISSYDNLTPILVDTFINMADGALIESNLTQDDLFCLEKTTKIIYKETSLLIENSLYLGYCLSIPKKHNSKYDEKIKVIGKNLGFLFQLLNDLEPFSSKTKNKAYKGKTNFDIWKLRKNYSIAVLYGLSSRYDQQLLQHLIRSGEDQENINKLNKLISKYQLETQILDISRDKENKILKNIDSLKTFNVNHIYIDALKEFFIFMLDYSYKKL